MPPRDPRPPGRGSVFHSLLRRFGFADLMADDAGSVWGGIRRFPSLAEYQRFAEYIEARVADGMAEELPVNPQYCAGLRSGGRWFREPTGARTWRLLAPEGGFVGRWERVLWPPDLIAAPRPVAVRPPPLCVPVVSFKRRFQVWMYNVSHSQLLLRSASTARNPTRVEILFTHAINVNIAMDIEDLEIEMADADTAAGIISNMGAWQLHTEQVFLIRGRKFSGHILADSVDWNEDEGKYPTPSALMELPGIRGVPVV